MSNYSHSYKTASGSVDDCLWTARELARFLRISESTVTAWVSRHPNRLPPPIRIGKCVRWRRETVLRWVEAQEPEPTRASRSRGRPRQAA